MRTSSRATLAEVARRAGVSTTTASYVLNEQSSRMRIAPDTQKRVRDAAQILRYRPNKSARSLRTARTGTIGMITDFVAGGMFASAMLSGANAAARAADHLLVMGESDGDDDIRDLLIEEMLEHQVDGIVYVTRTAVRTSLPALARGSRVVMLNCFDPTQRVPAVLPDEHAGGRRAADVLLGAGLTTDVYVVGEDPVPHAIAGPLRLAGIREGFAEAGAEVAGVVACDWAVEPAYDAVRGWLEEGHRPRALVCLNDRVAMGTYQALGDHGLEIPAEVSVVSFDGSELARWLRPHVTSIGIPFAQMGALAVRLLLDPGSDGGSTHLVPMPLVPGASVLVGSP